MIDVINGVSRELLEFIAANARGVEREKMDKLRALLSEQPQASAEIPFAGFDPNFCPGSNPDNPQTEEDEPQASAAQSAPAGEREAVAAAIAEEIDWLIRQWDAGVNWSGERMAELLEAAGKAAEMLTAQQRTQAAGVPDAWRLVMAIELAEEKHGSLRAAARALGIDAGYLSRLKKGEKVNPGEEVLAALGLERMTMYRASQQCTQSSWVPDGWQLVPKEPTAEMIEALAASFWSADWEAGKRLQRLRGTKVVFPKTEIEMAVGKYERLLAAAPAQPAAQGEIPAEVIAAAIRSVPAWSEISADLLACEIFDYLYPGQKRKTVNGHCINCKAVSQFPAGKCNCGKGE